MEKQHIERNKPPEDKPANLVLSIAAAFFGVQSDHNRQQDFSQQTPWPFIIAGMVGIVLFVGLLIAITLVVTATR